MVQLLQPGSRSLADALARSLHRSLRKVGPETLNGGMTSGPIHHIAQIWLFCGAAESEPMAHRLSLSEPHQTPVEGDKQLLK